MTTETKHTAGSDTPRTDEKTALFWNTGKLGIEMSLFSRKLERENADLLAALEAVSNYFSALDEMQPNANHSTEGVNIRAIARAALAKARGEA